MEKNRPSTNRTTTPPTQRRPVSRHSRSVRRLALALAIGGGSLCAVGFAAASWARSRLVAACDAALEHASHASPPPSASPLPVRPMTTAPAIAALASPSAHDLALLEVAAEIGFGQPALARHWLQQLREDVRAAADPDKERATESLLLSWEKTTETDNESTSRDGELRDLASCLISMSGGTLLDARRRVCDRLRARGLRRLEAGDLAGATEDLRTAADASPDPWAARADLARAEAAGGDPERARDLEFDVARHALSSGAPSDAIAAIDRLLERPGADVPVVAAACLLRATASLALARTESEAVRRTRILGDVIALDAIAAIESFASVGDVSRFGEAVALFGQAYREVGEDGRLRQLSSLLAARYPARVDAIDAALRPILESIASTATIGIARTSRGELLLPEGARPEVVCPGDAPRELSALPIRVPVADVAGRSTQLRVSFRDGRRILLPLVVVAGDNVRLEIDRLAQGFVFVPDRRDDRRSHTLAITPGFYIERTETSNVDFAAFLKSQGATDLRALVNRRGETFLMSWRRAPRSISDDVSFRPNEGDRPVTFVSAADAQRYATWHGSVLGISGLRLPTEREWQVAARAVDGQPYPWGSEWNDDRSNAFEDDDTGEAEPVDARPLGESFCGARQMAGNVAEIVETDSATFVAMGGSYRHSRTAERPLLLDERKAMDANERAIDVGFRCMASSRPAAQFPDGFPETVADSSRRRR